MRQVASFGRASPVLAFLAVVGLLVAGTASAGGTKPVTATTVTTKNAACTPAVTVGNTTITHCTGGEEDWVGDITGHGTYSYDRRENLTTGVRTVTNGVETITDACVRDVCGGTLFSRWNENDLKSGDLKLEQSFRGGTGAFTQAHGSIRVTDPASFTFTGQVGV